MSGSVSHLRRSSRGELVLDRDDFLVGRIGELAVGVAGDHWVGVFEELDEVLEPFDGRSLLRRGLLDVLIAGFADGERAGPLDIGPLGAEQDEQVSGLGGAFAIEFDAGAGGVGFGGVVHHLDDFIRGRAGESLFLVRRLGFHPLHQQADVGLVELLAERQ